MGRDSRGSYDDERDSGRRRSYDDNGYGEYTSGSGRSSRGGQSGAGRSRPDGYDGGRDDDTPRRRASRNSMDGQDSRGGPRSQPPRSSRGGAPDPYEDSQATRRSRPGRGDEDSAQAPTPQSRRSMAQMARDFSRTMSRQLGAVVGAARRAAQNAGRGGQGYANAPSLASGEGAALSASGRRLAVTGDGAGGESAAGNLAIVRYRRSRIRLRARKWRLGRLRANPIGYAIGVGITIALLVSIVGGTGASAFYAVTYYQQHIADIDSLYNLQDAQSTVIYDRNGKIIYQALRKGSGGLNIYVPLNQIGSWLQKATIDIEDHTFYSQSNIGIDFASTGRALIADTSSGGAAQGGSTITQQLVKNAILHDPTKAFQRKINEAIISVGMTVTGRYTKSQILEMYLNSIDYGDQNIGIEAAAENYFGLYPRKLSSGVTLTGAQQLDIAEAAMLAGVPNAPTEYQPNIYSCAGSTELPAPNGTTQSGNGNAAPAPPLNLNAKPPCASSHWDSPCVAGQDPRDLGCSQDFNYSYLNQGHEWIVYRRTEEVLNAMQQWGDITGQQHDQALQEAYDLLLYHRITSWQNAGNNFNHITNQAPHFVDYLKGYLLQNFGIENPLSSGLKIYTTLDLNLQNYAQIRAKYYIDGDPHMKDPYTGANEFIIPWGDYICNGNGYVPCTGDALSVNSNVHDAALVAIDAHSGDILAMVGSVDYLNKDPQAASSYNVATSPNRSMGSSTKPLVYTTAFQMGWTPGIMMQDKPICFPGTYIANQNTNAYAPNCKDWYSPTNYEQQSFTGNIPLRYGLANSLNIPATEALSFVGDTGTTSGTFLAAVRRLGINSVTAGAIGPSTALGSQDISLLDLTGAYQTFADNGKHVPYRAVLAIESPTGKPLWVAPTTPQAAQVLSPQTTYMLDSVLTDQQARIPDFNSPNPLEFNDPNFTLDKSVQDELSWMPGASTDPTSNNYYGGYGDNMSSPAIAAKTGTSQGQTGPRDIVTMGYSPYLSLGVWAGNAYTDLNPGIIGIAGAGYIFHDVMSWAIVHYGWHANLQFPIPQGMALGQFNCTTGMAPYKGAKIEPCKEIPGIGEPVCPTKFPLCATHMYSGDGTRIDQDWYILGQQWLES